VAEVPVRCVAFIARKQWFVAGSDDFQLRAFNYNTHEKVSAFEAHPDYIRCLTVHPTLPIVLTGSDDMTIKGWDWEKGWKNTQVCSFYHFAFDRRDDIYPLELDLRRPHTLYYEFGVQPQGPQHIRIIVSGPHCQDLVDRLWSS
jgi:WD40 repeat protein